MVCSFSMIICKFYESSFYIPPDQSKLMTAIGLSDSSDSSSDDIIPMQRRKRQRSYSKRR